MAPSFTAPRRCVEWRRDGKRHLLRTPGGMVRARQVVIAGNGYTGDRLHPGTNGRLLPVLSNIIVTRELTPAERGAVNWQSYLKIWDSRMLLFYYRLLPQNRVLFGARGGIEDTPDSNRRQKAWLERRFAEMFPPLAKVETEYFWRGWVCLSRDKNPHVGSIEDGTVHYALAYIGSGVALATYCGRAAGGADRRQGGRRGRAAARRAAAGLSLSRLAAALSAPRLQLLRPQGRVSVIGRRAIGAASRRPSRHGGRLGREHPARQAGDQPGCAARRAGLPGSGRQRPAPAAGLLDERPVRRASTGGICASTSSPARSAWRSPISSSSMPHGISPPGSSPY